MAEAAEILSFYEGELLVERASGRLAQVMETIDTVRGAQRVMLVSYLDSPLFSDQAHVADARDFDVAFMPGSQVELNGASGMVFERITAPTNQRRKSMLFVIGVRFEDGAERYVNALDETVCIVQAAPC